MQTEQSKFMYGFPGGSVVKNLPANAGDIRDVSLIPGSGRSPGEGNGNLLQYSCLENPTDRGAWRATVHRVTKCWTRLSTQHIKKKTQTQPEFNKNNNNNGTGITGIKTDV